MQKPRLPGGLLMQDLRGVVVGAVVGSVKSSQMTSVPVRLLGSS